MKEELQNFAGGHQTRSVRLQGVYLRDLKKFKEICEVSCCFE